MFILFIQSVTFLIYILNVAFNLFVHFNLIDKDH